MKRIDTINARENMFGVGKSGFHDNADLPGQDATYVSPEWFNTVQEELCNLLELRGITLDPASKRQLYDLLTTQADLEALADEIETNFIRKNQIVDNLTTNDSNKPVSAKQVKILQDNKLDKTENAASATKLVAERNINGVAFDGTKDINLPLFLFNATYHNLKNSRLSNVDYIASSDMFLYAIVADGGAASNKGVSFTLDTEQIIDIEDIASTAFLIISMPILKGTIYNLNAKSNIIKTWLEIKQ